VFSIFWAGISGRILVVLPIRYTGPLCFRIRQDVRAKYADCSSIGYDFLDRPSADDCGAGKAIA
jgi:hypothetical protein